MFPRNLYFSQTEVIKLFKITPKAYKALLEAQKIPVVSTTIDYNTYTLKTLYALKSNVMKLNLHPRIQEVTK